MIRLFKTILILISPILVIGQNPINVPNAKTNISTNYNFKNNGIYNVFGYNFSCEHLTKAQINAITTPKKGRMVYNTTLDIIEYYDGVQWSPLGAGGGGSSINITYGIGIPYTNGVVNGDIYVQNNTGDYTGVTRYMYVWDINNASWVNLTDEPTTAWYLQGTTTDANGNKTSLIQHNADIYVGGASPLGNTRVGNGAGNIATNTVVGYDALKNNTTGSSNIAIGVNTLLTNTTGSNNVGIGANALKLTNTSNNTAIGFNTMSGSITGSNNTAIGSNQQLASLTGSNQLNIVGAIFGTGLTGNATTPAGNIGVGVANPNARFHITSADAGIPISGVANTPLSRIQYSNGVLDFVCDNAAPWGYGIQSKDANANSALPFLLQPMGGNVGIGTKNPGYTLEVNGTARITNLPINVPGANIDEYFLGTDNGTNSGQIKKNKKSTTTFAQFNITPVTIGLDNIEVQVQTNGVMYIRDISGANTSIAGTKISYLTGGYYQMHIPVTGLTTGWTALGTGWNIAAYSVGSMTVTDLVWFGNAKQYTVRQIYVGSNTVSLMIERH